MIQREDRYSDFRHRIREADSHEDAEEILRDLTPERIEETCKRIVEKRGDGSIFQNKEFWVRHADRDMTTPNSFSGPRISLARKGGGLVYEKKAGMILEFKPMECWNILNLIEEIIDHGEIQI